MKNLKFLLVIICAILMIPNSTNAQDVSKTSTLKKHELKEAMQESIEKLALSPEQKTKFEEVSKKYVKEMKDVREPKEARLARKHKIKAIQDQKDAEMKNVLSATQFSNYLEMKKDFKNKIREKRVQ